MIVHLEKYQNIHSCLLGNSSEVLYEKYFTGSDGEAGSVVFNRNTLHELRSATKSITSLAVGICIDKGLMKSVNKKISVYFPEILCNKPSRLNLITVKDLLTMTSGIKWTQSGTRSNSDMDSETEMEKSKNPINYVLSQPVDYLPNTRFVYNSGNTVLLGKIVELASGMNFEEFVNSYIFQPLGVTGYHWWKPVANTYWTHAGLSLRPIDMLKIGQMLLGCGVYKEAKILSARYIVEMSSVQDVNKGYGYQFWRKTFDIGNRQFHSYYAAGNGGQYIFVFPSDNLTVVFSGGNYHNALQNQPFEILSREILTQFK